MKSILGKNLCKILEKKGWYLKTISLKEYMTEH